MQLTERKISQSVIGLKGDVLVIDSYDGALHPNRKNDESSVVSFSSQLISSQILNTPGFTARNSKNILTWMQTLCDEKPKNIPWKKWLLWAFA